MHSFECHHPVEVYGRGNKKGATPTIVSAGSCAASGDECYPDFHLLEEPEEWLEENIGYKNYSLGAYATDAYIGLYGTIYFRNVEDAVWFRTVWG